MNWFRAKIQLCARLALFALAFQLVVSFGHMHRDDLGLPPLPDLDSVQTASTTTSAPPADQDHHPAPDDYCPICASMQLIATALPSLPPVLLVPESIRPSWPIETLPQEFSPQVALSFHARAPPTA